MDSLRTDSRFEADSLELCSCIFFSMRWPVFETSHVAAFWSCGISSIVNSTSYLLCYAVIRLGRAGDEVNVSSRYPALVPSAAESWLQLVDGSGRDNGRYWVGRSPYENVRYLTWLSSGWLKRFRSDGTHSWSVLKNPAWISTSTPVFKICILLQSSFCPSGNRTLCLEWLSPCFFILKR